MASIQENNANTNISPSTNTVLDIMKKLTISDALAIKENFPESFVLKDCYDERVNPVAYLSGTFNYPLTLMSAMFDSGCVLSGSRALEFFVPGSARADSDWDFYVPAYKESVADMVNALSICGVTWHLKGHNITTALWKNHSATVSRQTLMTLSSWVGLLTRQEAIHVLGERLHNIATEFKMMLVETQSEANNFTINLDLDGKVRFSPSGPVIEQEEIQYEDALGRAFNILHGSISTTRGQERVQLIIGSYYTGIRSCMSFIKNFYASHVQCFIGGWCASHMYYTQASTRRATIWSKENEQRDAKVLNAIEKYRSRGFEFIEAKDPVPKTRTLNDDESMLLDYGDMYRQCIGENHSELLDGWLAERRKNIKSISWTEFGGSITELQSTWEKCFRGCKKTFANPKSDLPANRRRRLANIVALSTSSPDPTRSAGFRSSVGMNLCTHGWQMAAVARSGTVYYDLQDATPWSWVL